MRTRERMTSTITLGIGCDDRDGSAPSVRERMAHEVCRLFCGEHGVEIVVSEGRAHRHGGTEIALVIELSSRALDREPREFQDLSEALAEKLCEAVGSARAVVDARPGTWRCEKIVERSSGPDERAERLRRDLERSAMLIREMRRALLEAADAVEANDQFDTARRLRDAAGK